MKPQLDMFRYIFIITKQIIIEFNRVERCRITVINFYLKMHYKAKISKERAFICLSWCAWAWWAYILFLVDCTFTSVKWNLCWKVQQGLARNVNNVRREMFMQSAISPRFGRRRRSINYTVQEAIMYRYF